MLVFRLAWDVRHELNVCRRTVTYILRYCHDRWSVFSLNATGTHSLCVHVSCTRHRLDILIFIIIRHVDF